MIRRFPLCAGFVLLLAAMTSYAGGPPILTTSKVPEYFVVGRPELLRFVVRGWCCDNAPLTGIRAYSVRAKAGAREITTPVMPTEHPGEYTVELTLPAPGSWSITVDFYNAQTQVRQSAQLHRTAILEGSRTPDPLSLEARGKRDFVEKGCITCHVNHTVGVLETPWGPPDSWEAALAASGIPDLTDRKFPHEYLTKFLANPSSFKAGTRMPDLNLTSEDISALAAFINRERPARRTD
jgi:hypothetical protein